MLLQTNSYVVSEEKRPEHVRLMRRFAQIMARLGLEQFEVLEQIGPGFGTGRPSGRFVQIMRFRDKQHQQQVQALERSDPEAQELIGRFCELVEFAEQQQQGLATAHYYAAVVESGAPAAPRRERRVPPKLPGVAPAAGTTRPEGTAANAPATDPASDPAADSAAAGAAADDSAADPDVRDAEFEVVDDPQDDLTDDITDDDAPKQQISDDELDDVFAPAERKRHDD
ncbi:MAG: hypothetical protein ACFCVE_00300 [Phycisphaerae bacterium]